MAELSEIDAMLAEVDQDFELPSGETTVLELDAETVAALRDVPGQLAGVIQQFVMFRDEMAAPIECLRDPRGRLVAVRRGERVIPIVRNDEAARFIQ